MGTKRSEARAIGDLEELGGGSAIGLTDLKYFSADSLSFFFGLFFFLLVFTFTLPLSFLLHVWLVTAQIDSLQSYLVAALTRRRIYLRAIWPGILTGASVVRTRARLGLDSVVPLTISRNLPSFG
jgi:hypothetical protein